MNDKIMTKKSDLKTAWFAMGVLLLTSMASPAYAVLFSDFVDFAAGEAFQTVSDSASIPLRSWTHDIRDDLGPYVLDELILSEARLAFRYSKTEGNERWDLNQGVGVLPVAGNNALTLEFSLGTEALTDLLTDGLITFTAFESTVGHDTFRRFDATLTGIYTPKQAEHVSPEPQSAALIGLGITAFTLSRNLRNKKREGV